MGDFLQGPRYENAVCFAYPLRVGILTREMRQVVREQRLGCVATVCPDGMANLSPKGTFSREGIIYDRSTRTRVRKYEKNNGKSDSKITRSTTWTPPVAPAGSLYFVQADF